MAKDILTVIGGIFILIGIFLFLSHGDKTVKIIQTIASNSIKGIATLQGKDVAV